MLKNYWTSVELAGTTHVPEWGTDLNVSGEICDETSALRLQPCSLSWRRTYIGTRRRRLSNGCTVSRPNSI